MEFERNNSTIELLKISFSRTHKQYVASWKLKGYNYRNTNEKFLGLNLRQALNNWLGLKTFKVDIEFNGMIRTYFLKKEVSARNLHDAHFFIKSERKNMETFVLFIRPA